MSSREKILQYKSQGDIKIGETIERESKVGGGRRNKSQEKRDFTQINMGSSSPGLVTQNA